MCMLIHEIRYTKTKQKGIYPHIYKITITVQTGVCEILIYIDLIPSRVMLMIISISSNQGYVVPVYNLEEDFASFNLKIVKENMVW